MFSCLGCWVALCSNRNRSRNRWKGRVCNCSNCWQDCRSRHSGEFIVRFVFAKPYIACSSSLPRQLSPLLDHQDEGPKIMLYLQSLPIWPLLNNPQVIRTSPKKSPRLLPTKQRRNLSPLGSSISRRLKQKKRRMDPRQFRIRKSPTRRLRYYQNCIPKNRKAKTGHSRWKMHRRWSRFARLSLPPLVRTYDPHREVQSAKISRF